MEGGGGFASLSLAQVGAHGGFCEPSKFRNLFYGYPAFIVTQALGPRAFLAEVLSSPMRSGIGLDLYNLSW